MSFNNDPYKSAWKTIDSLESKGLPRSALERVESLYQKAKRDNNPTQVIKSLMYQVKYLNELEEEGHKKVIVKLQTELAQSDFPVKPILQSILAEVYWGYLQSNFWQISQRTEIADYKPDDLQTWSAAQLATESARLYDASLSDERLADVPLQAIEAITVKGQLSDGLRPTLFDFLAHRVIDHFSGEQSYLTEPAYKFYLDQEVAFADASDFAAFSFTTKDTASFKYKSLVLYQRLLRRHLQDADQAALIDLDLKRLQFGLNNSVVDIKDSLYRESLQRLYQRYASHPSNSEVIYAMAQWHYNRGLKYQDSREEAYRLELVKAKALCEEAAKHYPGAYGSSQCDFLKNSILTKQLFLTTEQVNVPGKYAPMLVQYRNIGKVYVKVVKIAEAEQQEIESWDFDKMYNQLNRRKAIHQWSTNLPSTSDFQPHSLELAIPPLSLGLYAVIASDNAKFNNKTGRVAFLYTNVSNIASLKQQGSLEESYFLTTDRQTGAPMPGVLAEFYKSRYDNKQRKVLYDKAGQAISDNDGKFISPIKNDSYRVKFSKGGDVLFPLEGFYSYSGYYQPLEQLTTHFFLDRAIYRPGQQLFFKAIILKNDANGVPAIVKGEKVTITLLDANMQETTKLELTTNQYGTVNGAFTTPTGGLLGTIYLRSSAGDANHGFQVEEYKRPRFETLIDSLAGDVRLGDKVNVTGNALAFAGSAVDGAKVTYRVVREVRYPWMPWWGGAKIMPPYGQSPSMEIARGETTTDAEGKFVIPFQAMPDRSADRSRNPAFAFTVYADVVDINGETRSAERTYQLAYVGLRADIAVPPQLEQSSTVVFPVSITNLDGKLQQSQATVEIFRLQSPTHPFIDRYWEAPDQYVLNREEYQRYFPLLAYQYEDDITRWSRQERVFTQPVNSNGAYDLRINMSAFPVGYYLVSLKTNDSAGNLIETTKYFALLEPQARRIPDAISNLRQWSKKTYQPGDQATLYLSVNNGPRHYYYELERKGKILKSGWLHIDRYAEWQQAVTEADRGNLMLHLVSVQHNRTNIYTELITVPWSNKALKISYSTFRDKLKPGQSEEWRIKISGPDGERVAAEMVAAMYDASLDQFIEHNWFFDPYPSIGYAQSSWNPIAFGPRSGRSNEPLRRRYKETPVRSYPYLNWFGFYPGGMGRPRMMYKAMADSAAPAGRETFSFAEEVPEGVMQNQAASMAPPPPPSLSDDMQGEPPYGEETGMGGAPITPPPPVQVRRNLKETVFFMPDLLTDAEGDVVLRFTMNEALTRWKLLTLAHTTDLKFALDAKEVVTQKELMVLPNAPRFVREGDEFWFSTKVSNLSGGALAGTVKLELFDALTMQPVDKDFGLTQAEAPFTAQAGQSAAANWRLNIPVGQAQALTWRVTATAGQFSDGEENALPILTNRMLVTETLPLPVRGKESKTFHFERLKQADESKTLQHQRYALEFTSNPAWYAVQALPYLMEYPYECTEQIFNRYYANALASSIANRYPKIKTVFESWKNTPALESNLAKNQELKSALLEETPWVLEAQQEAQQKKNIGLLFDLNKMSQERAVSLAKLTERQSEGGSVPWFPGGPDNWYITQYILEGFGHLHHLGIEDVQEDPAIRQFVDKGFAYVKSRVRQHYEELENSVKKGYTKWEDDHLDELIIHYLYTASLYPYQEKDKDMRRIVDYYRGQAEKYWLQKGLYQQGLLALALNRSDKKETAKRIVASLNERALRHPELGMYWKSDRGYFWYQLPVETQALMVEVFAEVAKDDKAVDDLKVWLLKNKQTNHWKTTKATASAVYALLANGENWLTEDQPLAVSFPDMKKVAYEPKLKSAQGSAEAGTGYFGIAWDGKEVNKKMAEIKVKNPNKSIAWGAVYWQYFEQLDKIKGFEDTPLRMQKKLFKEVNSDTGPKLQAVEAQNLQPGDKLIVRIELRVDRDMEYVHMKDMRASGLEPINVISQYKWQDGLGYYESTHDVSTNFFFEYLRKGTYVFEYPLRVSHRGDFSNGVSTIQCMYAPEFSSHSEGVRISVK
ncbi:MAG: hypothetical protein HUU34_01765 [Saprospiraceae bacterium]|nr:hypothetical protein [Saprospiraceae bacterium]